ncbi:TPA: hypothetical protein QCU10_005849 [Bacillus anthracis]|nr:hypothetical protein [Bacillus cereus biovar anthracis]HDR6230969.1 hypothetical protein [Bacillus cereus biovar anthracis]HDR6240496.1 hypothetical protein [Bacillus cereus biovar anthracis]HDR6252440.1 hypothetical protein [Bacillus cereus biovar anthracis]
MAITLNEKFAQLVDERFAPLAVTTAGTNQDYDWVGAQTIKVTAVDTVPMNDYKRSGTNRYGEPTELGNAIQEMTLTKDRGFTFTIDKMSEEETQIKASEALARQLREVTVPEIETYRLKVMGDNAGGKGEGTLTKENVYEEFLKGNEKLDDASVPENRVCFIKPSALNLLKLDKNFTKSADLAQDQILFKGQVGEVDGVAIIKSTAKFMGEYEFIIAHASVTVAPVKLAETKVHIDPPGLSGTLIEGRFYYDAFVRNQKKYGLYAFKAKAEAGTKSASK